MHEVLHALIAPHGAGPFPKADWSAVREHVESLPEAQRAPAWRSVTEKWADHTCAMLTRFLVAPTAARLPYRIDASEHVLAISSLTAGAGSNWTGYGESAVRKTIEFLGPLAIVPPWPVPICMIHEPKLFDMYLDAVAQHRGTLPAGVYVTSPMGPPHIAVQASYHILVVQQIVTHELIHALIHHRQIPLWLEEGICGFIQERHLPSGQIRWSSGGAKRNDIWLAQGLDSFWNGAAFRDGRLEPYILAGKIVQRLLLGGRDRFRAFVALARQEDAGLAACRTTYDQTLAQITAEFLPAKVARDPSGIGAALESQTPTPDKQPGGLNPASA